MEKYWRTLVGRLANMIRLPAFVNCPSSKFSSYSPSETKRYGPYSSWWLYFKKDGYQELEKDITGVADNLYFKEERERIYDYKFS